MTGRRLPDGTDWSSSINPGDYWKHANGSWFAQTPNDHLANLSKHSVTEHDDTTITVSPCILVSYYGKRKEDWHGYLERGVWREC